MTVTDEKWIETREMLIWMLEKNATLEQAGIRFCISKSTLHWRIHHWCKRYDKRLYDVIAESLRKRQGIGIKYYNESRKETQNGTGKHNYENTNNT